MAHVKDFPGGVPIGTWVKSSGSENIDDCVELARLTAGDGLVMGLRDSTGENPSVLRTSRSQLSALTVSIRAGAFSA